MRFVANPVLILRGRDKCHSPPCVFLLFPPRVGNFWRECPPKMDSRIDRHTYLCGYLDETSEPPATSGRASFSSSSLFWLSSLESSDAKVCGKALVTSLCCAHCRRQKGGVFPGPNPHGALRRFRWGRNLGGYVTKFAPHKALKLFA